MLAVVHSLATGAMVTDLFRVMLCDNRLTLQNKATDFFNVP